MSTQPQTQTDQNKRLVRRFMDEGLNRRNLDLVDEMYAPNVKYHGPAGREFTTSAELKQMAQGYLTAFPDLKMSVVQQVAEGNLVSTAWSATGTNDGPLGDIPATGKKATVKGQMISRIENGKFVEEWELFDEVGMLQQLGIMDT